MARAAAEAKLIISHERGLSFKTLPPGLLGAATRVFLHIVKRKKQSIKSKSNAFGVEPYVYRRRDISACAGLVFLEHDITA